MITYRSPIDRPRMLIIEPRYRDRHTILHTTTYSVCGICAIWDKYRHDPVPLTDKHSTAPSPLPLPVGNRRGAASRTPARSGEEERGGLERRVAGAGVKRGLLGVHNAVAGLPHALTSGRIGGCPIQPGRGSLANTRRGGRKGGREGERVGGHTPREAA